jgi:hypothetical protein
MAGCPTSSVNRAAKPERDMPASLANPVSDQSASGRRWISASARPICGSRKAASHPCRASGAVSSHSRIAWITRISASRVITVSPPGRSDVASRAISPSVLCTQASVASSQA